MAREYYAGANVNLTGDSWATLFSRTNDVLFDMSTVVLTGADVAVANLTNGSSTTGNTHVVGYFAANTLIAVNELRGGVPTTTFDTSAVLTITSNTVIGNTTVADTLDVYGDVDLKAHVILGDSTADRLSINAYVNTDIIPEATATRDLGTNTLRWENTYANNLIANSSLTVTAANPTVRFEATDDSATVGPVVELYRNSATTANTDVMGEISFTGEDVGGNKTTYGAITSTLEDNTDTSEDGSIAITATIAGSTQDAIQINEGADQAVKLFYNGSQKLATKTDGVDVTGEVQSDSLDVDGVSDVLGVATFHANVDIDAGQTLNMGTSLDIISNTTASYIQDSGAGSLYLDTDSLEVRNAAGTETLATFAQDGAVSLNFDNATKLATKTDGVTITGDAATGTLTASGEVEGGSLDINGVADILGVTSVHANVSLDDANRMLIGTGDDLQVYHDATDSYIDNQTGELYIQGSGITLRNSANTESYLTADVNGGVTLYHDDAAKLETQAGGVLVTGELESTTLDVNGIANIQGTATLQDALDVTGIATFNANVDLQDNDSLLIGTGDDLRIYHDASDSYIQEQGAGDLYIQSTAGAIRLRTNTSENSIVAAQDGAVTLYFDNAAKIATKTDGVDVTGELQSDSLDVDGVADITGNTVFGDDVTLGANNYINLSSNANIRAIANTTDTSLQTIVSGPSPQFLVDADAFNVRSSDGLKSILFGTESGAVTLYNNGSAKISTKSTGVNITGELEADSLNIDGVADVLGNTTFQEDVLVIGDLDVQGTLTFPSNTNVTTNSSTIATLTVTKIAEIEGNTNLGNATTDSITVTGRVDSDVLPYTNNAHDLGSTGNRWRDVLSVNVNSSGTATLTTMTATTGTITDLDVTGTTDIGNATTDTLTVTARVDSSFVPTANTTYDLGTTGLQWNNVYGASFSGNAGSATKWATGRTISLTGGVTGTSAAFDGTGNLSIATTISGVALGTGTTGNYVATVAGTANEIEVSGSGSETAAVTIGLPDDVTIGSDLTVTSNTQTDNLYVVGRASSIAGADWDAGWLRIGTSTVGWSMDDNEIYSAGDGIIGSLTGNVSIQTSNTSSYIRTNADFVPTVDSQHDLGLTGARFRTLYVDDITVTNNVDGRDVSADGSKLDGIEPNATADQTASEILTLLKTVDGAGSGLDADTLDTLSSASFIRSDGNDAVSANTTWDDLKYVSLGTSADMRLTHDGTDSFIDNLTGALRLRNLGTTSGSNVEIECDDTSGVAHDVIIAYGGVAAPYVGLMYDNAARLQTTSGGINVDGTVTADEFSGPASGLTGLDAGNLSTGTVASARLSGTYGIDISGNAATVTNGVTTTGTQTIGGNKTFSDTVDFNGSVTLDGTTTSSTSFTADGGWIRVNDNIELYLGTNNDATFFHDNANLYLDLDNDDNFYIRDKNSTNDIRFTFASSTGDLTGDGACAFASFSGSGASLTSLNGSNISSGTVADARIAATIQRTTGSGAGLTALNGSQITTGTVADARIASTLTRDSEHTVTLLILDSAGSTLKTIKSIP